MRKQLLFFVIILSLVYSYKLSKNEVLDESLCPSHSAGSERLVFNAVMKGVGNNEDFKKTWLYDVMFNDFDASNDISFTLNRIWEERNYFPNNLIINVIVIIGLSLLFMLYLCFINPFCWCCSCCCLKDYTNEEATIPQVTSNPSSPTNKSKKTSKKAKSKNDCCSCCCCCCGIKCGYCVVTFSFLCCVVAMFFAIFAFANHPLSGYPDRLIGNVNTAEEKGITRITNSISDLTQSVLVVAKSQVISKLLFNIVGNETLSQMMSVVTTNFNMTNVADSVNNAVKILNKLPKGNDIQSELNQINSAITTFPNETYVTTQIGFFNDEVDKLTTSMSNTRDTMQLCNNNSNNIDTNPLKDSDMHNLDKFVLDTNAINIDNLNNMNEVPSEFNLFTNDSDCKNLSDKCKDNMTNIMEYLKKCNASDIDLINQFYEDNKSDIFRQDLLNSFKKIQNDVDKIELKKLTDDNIIASLNTFKTSGLDSLREILDGINLMINSLPDFNSLADKIQGILGITDAIPEISRILDEINNLANKLVDLSNIDNIKEQFDSINDTFNQLNNTVSGVIGDIRRLNDKIKEEVNMTELYDIINVEVNNTIDKVMKDVNFNEIIKQLENITTEADKYIFKIYNNSVEIKEKLNTFNNTYKDTDLKKFKQRCVVDEELMKKFNSYLHGECNDSCKDSIKEYFEKNKDGNDIKSLISAIESLKTSTSFKHALNPYSMYKIFVQEYSNTIKKATNNDKQNEIISFLFL